MKYERKLAHKWEDVEQTIAEHAKGTAYLAEKFADACGLREQGRMVGLLHDIGKFSDEFQERIRDPEHTRRCNHSTAGAIEAKKNGQLLVSMCILGHHSGLSDFGGIKGVDERTFAGKIKKGEAGDIPDYSDWAELEKNLDFSSVPPMKRQDAFASYLETRMLYSALVDADFLDTEKAIQGDQIRRGANCSMVELLQRLEAYIADKGYLTAQDGINGMRAEILESMSPKGEELPRGSYTLTVPTGGGKTISSLRFALHHAVQQGLERIIYVIPYTNIIEQTAEVFGMILGPENVLEHHSQVEFEEGSEESDRKKLASENWDMPIIVTTMVQFFESLFHHKPARSRKLHNIANSVIIYDEVQMLPVSYWTPCVRMIQELRDTCRTTQVFCTATQPGISLSDSEENPIQELTSRTREYFQCGRRVTFRDAGTLTADEVADEIEKRARVLCIVNTKKTAREIFDRIRGKDHVFHLTTMMVPQHRVQKLEQIRKCVENGENCRVVATSLVEAGVDLDFDFVMRELAGLDSILQAAGRCNRNGRRPVEKSVTEVFSLGNNVPDSIRQQVDVSKYVTRHFEQWDSLEAINYYFMFWRDLRGANNLDVYQIMDKIEGLAFQTVSDSFHIIEDKAVTVYIPWGEEGESLIGKLEYQIPDKMTMRRLGRYGVPIYRDHFNRFLNAGEIKLVWEEIPVLRNMDLYDQDTGLAFQGPEGEAWFI